MHTRAAYYLEHLHQVDKTTPRTEPEIACAAETRSDDDDDDDFLVDSSDDEVATRRARRAKLPGQPHTAVGANEGVAAVNQNVSGVALTPFHSNPYSDDDDDIPVAFEV